MALKELRMEHFLGKTVTHRFHQKNKIKGANGTGKTSIKEAICFLFTGMDSAGSRNPQHLISKDEDGCKVTIITDKAEISRSLTRKGNGTLKLVRQGVAQALTQAQMEASVGSTDLFLSAFVPGYFLELSTEKQHKIISEVSPKVDRAELIKDLSGMELTPEEQIRYGITRRVDLVANSVASDRREFDRQMSMKQGEVKQLQSLQPLPKPEYPAECDRIQYFELLHRSWQTYETDLRAYNNLTARYERTKIENDLKESKRKELKERLASLKPLPVPPEVKLLSEADVAAGRLQAVPQPPLVGKIIEVDHCPTCGQTVGKAHREHVTERNRQIMADYEKEAAEVRAKNEVILKEIRAVKERIQKEYEARNQVIAENNKIASQIRSIEIELASLVDSELPVVPDQKPTPPEEMFNSDQLELLRRQKGDYEKALAQYEFVEKQIKDAAEKVQILNTEIENLAAAVERLQKFEDAIRQIPQEELKRQMQAFKMKTVVISVGEKIEVSRDGIAYQFLSTGQKAKADVEICQKLNSLMPKPINMIFLDNADLVDEVEWGEQQMFAAYVDKSVEAVQIESVG